MRSNIASVPGRRPGGDGQPPSWLRFPRPLLLRDYPDLVELERGVKRWFHDYNHERIHQGLAYARPWEVYRPKKNLAQAA